jgi:hypothetical protein
MPRTFIRLLYVVLIYTEILGTGKIKLMKNMTLLPHGPLIAFTFLEGIRIYFHAVLILFIKVQWGSIYFLMGLVMTFELSLR